MGRINPDFERLQPVAVDQPLKGKDMAFGCDKTVKLRESRGLTFAKIGEYDAIFFNNRVRFLVNSRPQRTALGFRRSLEALALRIKQPAMERATQPAIFKPTEGEIRATMRTVPVQQSQFSRLVAKQNEILPQKPDRPDRALRGQFFRQCGGLPVAAQ